MAVQIQRIFMFNPLDRLLSAKVEVDTELAVSVERQLIQQEHFRQQAAESVDRELAQKFEQEEKDEELAAMLYEQDRQLLIAEQQQESGDAEIASAFQQQLETQQMRLLRIEEEDAKHAADLQKQLQLEALKEDQKINKERKWIDPQVTCEDWTSTDSASAGTVAVDGLRVTVKLPNLKHADVTVNRQTKDATVINIDAFPEESSGADSNFVFDLKLVGSDAFALRPEDVTATYDDDSGMLTVICRGIRLNKETKKSIVQHIKDLFFNKNKNKQ